MDTAETTGGEFNLHEAANEIIAEGDSGSASTEAPAVEGQADASQSPTEGKELSPEEILKQVSQEKEAPEQFAELLKGVNGLGMVRNGAPVSIESADQLKELVQKGFDYTQKTMEHAELVKAKDAEYQQKEAQIKEASEKFATERQQFEQALTQNQLLGAIIQKIQSEDPELFNHLDSLYQKEEQSYQAQMQHSNRFKGEIDALKGQIQSIQGQKQAEELTGIKQGWEKELSDVQSSHAASLAKLGVKVDWNKVKDVWAADTTNKMSVEQALYAAFGKDIVSANESHKKLLATKAKTQASMLNRSGVGGGGQRGADETVKAAPGDYENILRMASANM